MFRTHHCNELSISDIGKKVILSGWVHKIRNLGAMAFIDLRDRYGITQLATQLDSNKKMSETIASLGREFVIQVSGIVIERTNKNQNLPTGEIEVDVKEIITLNPSLVPPFTIENDTDGGEELRMKYRYLDLRRNTIKNNILLRNKLCFTVRNFLHQNQFIEIETPFLIKSTPEGARDFLVPSRMNEGQFYALPQSPQTFKQLLMVAGFDKYYQIVRCFRDEDLRADRQPEFTQIDCELSFVTQEDIFQIFEQLLKHVLSEIKGVSLPDFPRLSYAECMNNYGNDKPDLRFDMKIYELTESIKGHNFPVFDTAEYVGAIAVPGCAQYSRKQLDELLEWLKRPQIGALGMFYLKYESVENYKSSIDKFFQDLDKLKWIETTQAQPGDLILILAGNKNKTLKALGELRLEMANRLGLRDKNKFCPLWVTDFPLLEWDEEQHRWNAMHHPFTSPHIDDIEWMDSKPELVRANAYDLVLNGSEIAGGSIRIYQRLLQQKLFQLLGLSSEEAEAKFGFLMKAFEYGAPPHGGIAFGLDRLCAILGGADSIKDFIAFPKNNSGRDVMLDAPSSIDSSQLNELNIQIASR